MKKIILLISILSVLHSCKPKEDVAGIPSYIRFEKAYLKTDYLTEGDSFQTMTDIWLGVNGRALGAYEMPSSIPVLESGDQIITMQAGVKENGTSATRAIYPFFSYLTKNVNLQREKISTIVPVFKYDPKTKFWLNEKFESNKAQFEPFDSPSGNNTALITYPNVTETQPRFGGDRCMKAELSMPSKSVFYAIGPRKSGFTQGKPLWGEITFKTDVELIVGLFVTSTDGSGSRDMVALNPTNGQWKKVYINFTNIIADYSASKQPTFTLYVDCDLNFINSEYGTNLSSGLVYLDNIKLLYFE